MKPKNLSVRMDRESGKFFLTEEKPLQGVKRVADITEPVLMAFAADLVEIEHTTSVERTIEFADGRTIQIVAKWV